MSTDNLFPEGPTIQTERLFIYMPSPEMAPLIKEYSLRNRAHFSDSSPLIAAEDDSIETISSDLLVAKRAYLQGRSMRLYISQKDDFLKSPIGDIALSEIIRGPFQACFLGYRVDKDFQGRGFATEAVMAVVKFGFRELNLHRIMANYTPKNEGSGRVLRKAGFVIEGLARDYLRLNGKWHDHILTSTTNQLWHD